LTCGRGEKIALTLSAGWRIGQGGLPGIGLKEKAFQELRSNITRR